VRYFGTEVGREGVASQPVWPVRSRGTLVAYAWLFSFYLKKSDKLTTRAASAIRNRWTVWFNASYLVAERVSGAKQFSVHQIKGLRVAYLCRIARHEAQSVPSIIKGSRETARTASTQAGALSSLLPSYARVVACCQRYSVYVVYCTGL
jgi:hypothetical protein